MIFLVIVFVVAIASGATAAIAGFGIGSLMTPLLAVRYGAPLAILAVSIPHAVATALRCWRLRRSISRAVLRTFGAWSAAGGLMGAVLFTRLSSRALTGLLGALLLATAVAGLSRLAERLKPPPPVASVLGFLSGLFGGLAGNQGGLRAAALLTFALPPVVFVATSTAVGLVIDAARLPVYLWQGGSQLPGLLWPIIVGTAGVVVGTVSGERLLHGLPPDRFRRIVAALIGALGAWLLVQASTNGN